MNTTFQRAMRRIKKLPDSLVLKENLYYNKGSSDNSKIANSLYIEQNRLCAYTETYLGRTDQAEVEHFNPNLKYTIDDGYDNWFLVKAQWNREKGGTKRWNKFQPIMHPTDPTFEARIIYKKGQYILADRNDDEARNLRSYLKLDDELLDKERIDYIQRLREQITQLGLSNQEYVDWCLATPHYRSTIYFIRAIEEEFNVKVNFDLLPTK